MFEEFKAHVNSQFPFLAEGKLLIAVSGGIDSVVLSHLIAKMKLDFALCHCNFQLRGQESEDDETFVKTLASEMGVPFFTTRFNTKTYADKQQLSIQVAARNLRYQWFYELLEHHCYDYVLTGHNTNDNLETFLMNLSRGTGLDGLTGIPPINKQSVRPLLNFSRDDITMFAIKNGIVWREDRSNATIKYIRNKVRHKILPVLKEINPHILETFKNTLENLNESQDLIRDRIADITAKIMSIENDIMKFDIRKLNTLSNKKAYLYQALHEYGFTEWSNVEHLLNTQSGKQLFSKKYRLLKDRQFLILTPINKDTQPLTSTRIDEETSVISEPIHLELYETDLENTQDKNSIIVDRDLLKYPLFIRKWRHGDYICPTGMNGKKKLSQLFKDRKLSLIEKERIWLLTDVEDTIVWVVGMRQDHRFIYKSEKTTRKMMISFISNR
ncbi:MAG: tRNA lysidine(34) synthetase TilS [Flavobacteriaceae bacterium]|nr:tRNA lysidine(34) synthetase TilS [Flavobacteriaceae bacterium]